MAGAKRRCFLAATGGLLLLGTVVASSPPAGAHGLSAGGVAHASPVGSYSQHSSDGGHALFVINSDHTFTTDIRESGTWISLGSSIALRVDSSTTYLGCVYLGTFNKKGINASSKPGPVTCSGTTFTWFAIKLTGTQTTASAGGRRRHSDASAPRAHLNPVGTYHAYALGGFAGPVALEIEADGFVQLSAEGGYWISSGTSIGFSLSLIGTSSYCIAIGTIKKTSIGTVAKPGLVNCPGDPIGAWHAVKTH